MNLTCCYIADEHQAELASWEPKDVSLTDPDEHLRRHARVRELACQAPAEWMISDGPTTDDYTHACSEHLSKLLTYEKVSTVWPIELAA